jgi:mRNA interferase RelE/StbE
VTASYSLFIKRGAEKELRSLPKADLSKVIHRIRELVTDPRPPGCQKLSGHNHYRIRQGDYRILYTIDDSNSKIEIVKIGHRREVYR